MPTENPGEKTEAAHEKIDRVKNSVKAATGEKGSLMETAWQMNKNAYRQFKEEIKRNFGKPSADTLYRLREAMYKELFDDLAHWSKEGFYGHKDFHYVIESDFGADLDVKRENGVFSVKVHRLRLNDRQWFEAHLGLKAEGLK